jgi:hypothetical protein
LGGILYLREGVSVNTQLKRLIKELGEAINGSLSESDQIAQVIARIKEEGYDVFLVLEATIGFNHRDDEAKASSPELVSLRRKSAEPDFAITAHDVRFLKSLRISVDDPA